MQQCGIENEQLVLVLEDHHVVDPSFLEIVNSLLSAGEVPGLYTPEELEPLLAPLRDQASEEGFRGPLVQYFANSERPQIVCKIKCKNMEKTLIIVLPPLHYFKNLNKETFHEMTFVICLPNS